MDKIVEVPGVGRVAFPDSMSNEEIATAIRTNILKQEPPKERSFGQELGRQAGLAGRYAIEGLTSLPAVAADALSTFAQVGPNPAQFGNPAVIQRFQQPNTSGAISDLLTRAGFPQPEGSAEKLIAAPSRALSSGAGLLGVAQRASGPIASTLSRFPGQQATGAVGSGLAAEYAKQVGAPGWVQLLAALGGGVAAPLGVQGAASLTGSAARGVRAAAQPFMTAGRERIAGTILRNQADDAGRAIDNLDSATEIIPGSIPTAGAASRDAGLLALEKGIRSRNPSPFATRLSEQNAARQTALDRIAGTPADIADDVAKRSLETTAMREAALDAASPADVSRVDRTISRILNSEAGERQAVSTALNSVRKRLYEDYPDDQMIRDARSVVQSVIGKRMSGNDFNALREATKVLNSAARGFRGVDEATAELRDIARTTTSKTASEALKEAESILRTGNVVYKDNASRLYGIRKHIGDLMEGSGGIERAQGKVAKKQLLTVRDALDDALEDAAPGFKAYLARYAEMSKPINQKEVLQELQRRSALAAPDVSTGRDFLSQAQFTRNLDNILRDPLIARSLTDDQVRTAKAVAADLDLGAAINSPLIRAPGSDTTQNLSLANIAASIRQGNTRSQVPRIMQPLLKPFERFYKYSDEQINELLTEAMLDPKLAAQMLKRATPSSAQTLSNNLMLKARQLGLGAGVGTAATTQKTTEPRATGR